jgi:hypothetical protein
VARKILQSSSRSSFLDLDNLRTIADHLGFAQSLPDEVERADMAKRDYSLIAVVLFALCAGCDSPQKSDLKGSLGEWGDVKLERSECLGFCPAYEVSIAADGRVTYVGRHFVGITGQQVRQADPTQLATLHAHIQAADFFALRDSYVAEITDLPTYRVTVTIGGRTKTVEDYVGAKVGMPPAVTAIENEIDSVANSAQWVRGGNRP